MGKSPFPACLHCGHLIDRADKPFCSKCGNRWNIPPAPATLPSKPFTLPSTSSRKENASLYTPPARSSYTGSSSLIQVKDELMRITAQMQQQSQSLHATTARVTQIPAPVTQPLPTPMSKVRRVTIQEHTQPAHVDNQETATLLRKQLQPPEHATPPAPADAVAAPPVSSQPADPVVEPPVSSLAVAEPVVEPSIAPQAVAEVQTPVVSPVQSGTLFERLQRLSALTTEDQLRHYLPGTNTDVTGLLHARQSLLEVLHHCVTLQEQVQLDPQHAAEIHNLLDEAIQLLDVTQPYKFVLLDQSHNATSPFLAALLGEALFFQRFAHASTRIRTIIRFCPPTEQEKLYIHYRDTRPPAAFFRKEWHEVWSEPEQIPLEDPASAVAMLEFIMHAGTTSFLPVNSTLLLLPILSATQSSPDAQVLQELQDADASILVFDADHLHSYTTWRMLDPIKQLLFHLSSHAYGMRKLFLAAASLEATSVAASPDTETFLDPSLLLLALSTNYRRSSQHASEMTSAPDRIRVFDAYFAMLGLQRRFPPTQMQNEVQNYLTRLQALYDTLRQHVPSLPPTCTARYFHEITPAQHEAMLQQSSLPTLLTTIQERLLDQRFHTRLKQAYAKTSKALQRFEDACWSKLDAASIRPSAHTMEALEEALVMHAYQRRAEQRQYLSRRIQSTKHIWRETFLQCIRDTTSTPQSPTAFHTALSAAHQHALQYVRNRIQQGYFDRYLQMDQRPIDDTPMLSIDRLGREVHLSELLGRLRVSLRVAVEEEMSSPAQTLAAAFLTPLEQYEHNDGLYGLAHLTGIEREAVTDEMLGLYTTIKNTIRQKARQACHIITTGALLSEERRLHRSSGSVCALVDFVQNSNESTESFLTQVHERMMVLIEEMHKDIVEQTERPILDFFRYELDQLETYEVYARHNGNNATEPGSFTLLMKDLEDRLVNLLHHSEAFRQQIHMRLFNNDEQIETSYNLLKTVKKLRSRLSG